MEVQLNNIVTPLVNEKRVFKLSTFQEECLKANSSMIIYAENPLSESEVYGYSACLVENNKTGFFEESEINVIEGVYANNDVVGIQVNNPNPWEILIPSGTEFATFSPASESKSGTLDLNELIQVTDFEVENRKFEHFRK